MGPLTIPRGEAAIAGSPGDTVEREIRWS
ncbi:rCG28628 [Rattus norvegicus]|uniref:RCG28628 n=1 Tax=Rattus norvegicus TaxID=10116 RepID=A6HWN2_RAT|nr:rCG28628 [Rattus norvegicus]